MVNLIIQVTEGEGVLLLLSLLLLSLFNIIQVTEGEGVSPLLTLRTLESVLFHNPGFSVKLVRKTEKGSWGELEEEVTGLQESGYRIEVLSTPPDLQQIAWRINSPTILLKRVSDEEKVFSQKNSEAEIKNEKLPSLSQLSPSCEEEGRGLEKLTGVKINIELDFIRKSSSKSLCRRILNENCILSNIVV